VAPALHQVGLVPTLAFEASQVLACLNVESFDLLIIEMGLARPSPEVFLETVHSRTDAALLAVGDTDLPPNRLYAAGVHEQVTSDVPPLELAVRGAALVSLRDPPDMAAELRWGPLEIDLDTRQAVWRTHCLELTPMQLRILTALVLAHGAVVSTHDLSRLIWRTRIPGDDERIFAHIRRIRRKVERDPSHPHFLLTVRGEGFRLSDAERAPHFRRQTGRERPARSTRVSRRVAREHPSAAAG